MKVPGWELDFQAELGSFGSPSGTPEVSMRGAQQIRSTAEGARACGASRAISLGTGIYLLRPLVGLVAGAAIAGIYATFNLLQSTDDSLTGHPGITT